MRIVPWVLRVYCHLVKAGFAKDSWESYKKYQDLVLKEMNK
jgi:hypothetical protein